MLCTWMQDKKKTVGARD
uniref:KRABA domaincontaining protein 2like [Acyrthosiphon pisum] n=1 Tax=Lepeophtheirus salmonis TaxID=72036 RepID=A0A0K2V6I0_LEPSM